MFLRATIRKKDGKEHRYWSVVEQTYHLGRRPKPGPAVTPVEPPAPPAEPEITSKAS